MRVIGVLLARPAADEAVDAGLDALRNKLDETGVHFLGIDDDHVRFAVHGQERPPASARQLGEMLGEIRQAWRA
jgi:molybdate-binding protein